MSPDFVNGLFEVIAAAISTLNVHRLIRDKQVQGVSLLPTVFFTLWGVWNLYFYPTLSLSWSFYGAIGMALVNCTWLGLAVRYQHRAYAKIYEDHTCTLCGLTGAEMTGCPRPECPDNCIT